MKKALLLLFAMFAVVSAASVATAGDSSRQATATVSITATGFKPENVTIKPGDSVLWKNADTTEHQVVSDTDTFKSPVLKPGQTFTQRFDVESSYSYHDATKTSLTGAVHVLTSNVSVSATREQVVFGNPLRIFGSIPSGATGETVTVHIRQYGKPEITRNVVTLDGTYELPYRPRIRTEVFATWNGTTSRRAPTIGVRPLVIFRPVNLNRNLFFVRVKAARSYAHKIVRINRQNSSGRWITTRIVRLNRFGEKRFTGRFPMGGTTKAQAWVGKAPGYVPGFSVIKFVSR
jgi:plastocyanin